MRVKHKRFGKDYQMMWARTGYLKFSFGILLVLLIFNMAFGLLINLESATVHRLIFEGVDIKLLLVILVYGWILLFFAMRDRPNVLIDSAVFRVVLLFQLYALFDWIVLWFHGYPATYFLFSFLVMYFYPTILLVVVVSPYSIDLTWITKRKDGLYGRIWLIYGGIALIMFPLAIWQYHTDKFIVPSSLFNGYWVLLSATFAATNHVRATGFFDSGAALGQFSGWIVAFSLARLLFLKSYPRKVVDGVWVLVAGYVTAITLTRTTYVYEFLVILTLILLKGRNGVTRVLPYFYVIVTIIGLLVGSVVVRHNLNTLGLVNTLSLSIRYQEWANEWQLYVVHSSVWNILFGRGLLQNPRFSLTKGLIIDNSYLAIYIYSGFFGLIAFFTFFAVVWRWIVERFRRTNSWFVAAFAAKMSALLVIGLVGNEGFGSYDFFLLLAIILLVESSVKTLKIRSNNLSGPEAPALIK